MEWVVDSMNRPIAGIDLEDRIHEGNLARGRFQSCNPDDPLLSAAGG